MMRTTTARSVYASASRAMQAVVHNQSAQLSVQAPHAAQMVRSVASTAAPEPLVEHHNAASRQETTSHTSSKASSGGGSPFASGGDMATQKVVAKKPKAHSFVPRKAPVNLTEKSRLFFKALLENASPSVAGVMLNYHQSSSGEPRMVFSFGFVKAEDVTANDER